MSIAVPIDTLEEKDLDILEKKLVIELAPKQKNARRAQFSWKPVEKVHVYRKEGDHLMIPFHWGISYFGKRSRKEREACGTLVSRFQGCLRPEQNDIFQESVALLNQSSSCLMAIYPGGGKCLGRGTEVRLWNGTSKRVEDVCQGDVLCGDDGTPRNVVSTCKGVDTMFRVGREASGQLGATAPRSPADPGLDGPMDYRVNSVHILTVYDTVSERLVDIGIDVLLAMGPYQQKKYHGVYFDYDHPVHFDLKEKRTNIAQELASSSENAVPWTRWRDVMLCGLRWYPFIDDPSRIRVDDPYNVLVHKDKRVMVTYPLRITQESGCDEYFGFVIDGNRRFLLANGICTHNTITSLSIASTINTRTMIFVNKLVLIDQWLATIYRWFGASTAVQVIQGKSKALVPEKDFYIVNALNVKKHLFTEYEKLGIGLLIVDECHLMMTKIFSQALSYIRPRYLMGLSATPYRLDGFDILLELYFGLHKVIRKLQRPHTVYCMNTEIVIQHDCDGRGDIIWNSVIDKQTSDGERNLLIASTCQKYPDRNILILSKRIKQIEEISRYLQGNNENVTVMKENDNTFDEDARILVATFQKVGTGFSHDKLDMLILASDTEEYFIQYLGRVFRRPDVEPIVIDFVDKHPILKKHFLSRKKVYEQCGGVVKYVKM